MSSQIKKFMSEEMLWISVGIAIVYWVIESIFWVFSNVELGFFAHFFRSDLGELGSRLIVVCLIVIFGSHAQYSLKTKKKSDMEIRELEELNAKLQQEISELRAKL
jgi:hypothetical protein